MWKDKIIAAVVTFQRNKILPLSIMNCCAVFWHLTWLPGSYFIFHRYLNQRSPLLQLYTVYLVLISLRSFFNFFISMKPQCWEENNNNWSWCHDRRSVVFSINSSLWRGFSVRGLYRQYGLFLKNHCSNFRLGNKTWCCFY